METIKKLEKNGIHFSFEELVELCEKYYLSELSIFGSSLRDDFNGESDIDILVSWKNYQKFNKPWDFINIEEDFKVLFNRKVDIVEKEALSNPIRRQDILAQSEILYAN